MSKYQSMTKEELIEELEDRDEAIEDLKSELYEAEVERDTLSSDLSSLESELVSTDDEEAIAEKAFNAGFESNSQNQLSAWLNYKIGARL